MTPSVPTEGVVTLAVLGAAFMHAAWHAALKTFGEQLSVIATVYGAASVLCACLLPFAAVPASAAWPYLALSVLLHLGSYVYIARCYEMTNLSSAFPLFRGLAPILVAAGAWSWAGEAVSVTAMCGLGLAATGVMSLAFERGAPWRRKGGPPLIMLAISAAFVAGYTVVDGLGVRLAGDAVGYVLWLFALNGPAVVLTAWCTRRERFRATVRAQWRRCAGASVVAILSHGIVIWAMTVGAIATVAALRETAVIFAAILGSTVLREPFGRTRVGASVLVAAGVALLHQGQ